jgi:hypothetical protein
MDWKRALLLSAIALINIALASCSGKPADQKMYEEIIATMSAEKAKKFFYSFPQSPYRDRLVNEMIDWCKEEKTKECYKLILEALPKEHPKYGATVSYYQGQFGKNN